LSFFSVIRETFSSRNLAVLTVTQTATMFTAFLWWPYRSLFILELGATKELLGQLLMIETISQIIFQLPGGILADRLGRRRIILLSRVIRLGSPLIYLFATHWIHIAPGLLLASAGMLGIPAVYALIAESLPAEGRGSGFAAYRMVTMMPMIVTSLLGGILMDYFGVLQGVRYVLMASVLVAFFSIFVCWRFLTETLEMAEPQRSVQEDKPRPKGAIQEFGRMPRDVWVLTAVGAISAFAMRSVWSFMVIYAVEEVGLSTTQWGLIGTVVSLITTAITIPGGMLADRIGRKPCIIISRVLSSFSTLGFTFAGDFLQMGAVRALGGVASGFGGIIMGMQGGPVWQALVADITPPEERGRMMGMMGTISGIVSTPASWAGGYMYENISPALPFQASFLLDIAGTAIFVALFKEHRERVIPEDESA